MIQEDGMPEKRKVLDHMARIEIDMLPDEPCIVSFHYMYKDYLLESNLMDVRFKFKFSYL